MTSKLRAGLTCALALIVSAAFLSAGDIASSHPVVATAADLTVHEWGTFTSVAGEDGSAVDWDTLGCKDDLPGFVNEFGYRGFKWRLQGTVRMETPVMYFYAPHEVEAHVQVAFPKGLMTESYPAADYQVYQTSGDGSSPRRLPANISGIDTSLRSVTGAIEWSHIKVQPNTAPVLPLENGPSRYYAARETDAAPIAVGDQHEKFLFYRGVGRFAVPLSARIAPDGTILVQNRGQDDVPTVILFENRGGRIGYRDAGALGDTQTIDPPSLDDSLPQLRYDLENALVDQGLFLKEAQAMVETWRDSWFEEGARLVYIMPTRAVDMVLPLHVEPSPSQIARVFVGRIELLTPATTTAVQAALAAGDVQTLARYRRFLEPILRRVAPLQLETTQVRQLISRAYESTAAASACR
jgi:hypothetical protein